VLTVIATRPRQLPPRLAPALDRVHRDGTLERLELRALNRDDARALVGQRADEIYEESGGNPFYLEQLARGGAGAGEAAAGVDDVKLAGLQVPPQVAAALMEELALLDEAARCVLEGASVAGDPFELDLAAAAADLPEAEVFEALDELVGVDFVRATDLPRRFRFRHPIVRRAVYEATRGGWRIGAHERVATALARRGAASTSLAHHVERCARHGDEQAIAALKEAALETASRAPATAARWFEAALRLLPERAAAEERVELLLALARARVATGEFASGHASLLESLEIVPPGASGLRTRVATSCAHVEHLLGKHEPAHERVVQALAELPDERTPEAVSLMIELSLDGDHRLQYASPLEWAEKAAVLAADLGDPALHAEAVAAAARTLATAGRVAEAVRRCDEAAALIDALSDRRLAERLQAITMLAGAELYLHRFAAGQLHAERALSIGRATGQGQQFPQLFGFLGIGWYLQGKLDVTDALDAAVEAARLTGNAQTLAWSLYPRSLVALAVGEVALALSAAEEAVEAVDDGGPNHHAAHSALAYAEASLELGRPDRAIELLERTSGGPEIPLASPSFRASFLERIARGRLMMGDVAAAQRAAECAQESAADGGLPFRHAEANRASAAVALHTGDAALASHLALAAAEQNEAVGSPMEASRSLILAGRALAAAGRRDQAREVLERAARDLEARGAVRYRDAAERELRQLGHRIHRRSQPVAASGDGVAALTRRELEIARRIVDRQTNREIAEGLFLSTKTVETHIRNIFVKLGADSRVEVARMVERADRASVA
jgi:DNA-binding CsgD family transcriptional regulator